MHVAVGERLHGLTSAPDAGHCPRSRPCSFAFETRFQDQFVGPVVATIICTWASSASALTTGPAGPSSFSSIPAIVRWLYTSWLITVPMRTIV